MPKQLIFLANSSIFIFFLYSILGFIFWLNLLDAPISFTKTLIPICFIPFSYFIIKKILNKFFLITTFPLFFLIIYAFFLTYLNTSNVNYIFGYNISDIRSFYISMQSRWVMYFLLGSCFYFTYHNNEKYFLETIKLVWFIILLLCIYLLISGFSIASHIADAGAEKINYRHVLSDWLAITALFIFIFNTHSRHFIFISTSLGLIIIGGIASLFAFFTAIFFFMARETSKHIKFILFLFLLGIMIFIFLAGEQFTIFIGKEDSLIARLYFIKTQFQFYWQSNPILGDFAGFYRLGPGTYAHNFLSYLYSYGLIFFTIYFFIILYLYSRLNKFSSQFMPLFIYVFFLISTAKSFTWGLDWFSFGFLITHLMNKTTRKKNPFYNN